ncbi:VanZ family protein [Stenotrophomonas sp. C3(2023)]|uniref:VanZ family protein n=1 Tax=Stenotrophomonas sp. C3(2023) TaxID=3080277 RepID=UPI00293C1636|nr:VanZ family protein [Stenotrophomonas sp. C3(2023)]MDV3467530.1 VanZ family protein [Stenotrophomonas sp. C3(2023)]
MTAALCLKPLRRPVLWASLWWLAVLGLVVVCLMPPPPLALPAGSDKVEHFLAYFLLAASAVQLYRGGRPLLWVGLGLVLLGIGIEFAQGALTATRVADPFDAAANTVGVLAGLATALTPLRDLLLRLKG